MADTLPALTLHAPWAYAVAWKGKNIENRTWAPPARLVGQRLAIHAGLAQPRADWDALSMIAGRLGLVVTASDVPRGAIVAIATVAGLVGEEDARANPWFVGPCGWILRDVVTLPEPVPCKGAQGIWRLPVDVDTRVQAQIARAV